MNLGRSLVWDIEGNVTSEKVQKSLFSQSTLLLIARLVVIQEMTP